MGFDFLIEIGISFLIKILRDKKPELLARYKKVFAKIQSGITQAYPLGFVE